MVLSKRVFPAVCLFEHYQSVCELKIPGQQRFQPIAMSDDDSPFLEWSLSDAGDRALLTIHYDPNSHEQLWATAKQACQLLLGFTKAFTECTVHDYDPTISSFPERVRQDFAEEWCTLFQVDVPQIGNVSAVGKGDNKRQRELAGAIAMIASAWLLDKANGREVLRTVEKEPCRITMFAT